MAEDFSGMSPCVHDPRFVYRATAYLFAALGPLLVSFVGEFVDSLHASMAREALDIISGLFDFTQARAHYAESLCKPFRKIVQLQNP